MFAAYPQVNLLLLILLTGERVADVTESVVPITGTPSTAVSVDKRYVDPHCESAGRRSASFGVSAWQTGGHVRPLGRFDCSKTSSSICVVPGFSDADWSRPSFCA
jgi:hypothetical protein